MQESKETLSQAERTAEAGGEEILSCLRNKKVANVPAAWYTRGRSTRRGQSVQQVPDHV